VEYNDPYVMEQLLPVELCVLVPAPELSISKGVDPLEQFAGDPVTYTVVFGNNGTAEAVGVVVSDVLPSEVEFVSADQGGTYTRDTRWFRRIRCWWRSHHRHRAGYQRLPPDTWIRHGICSATLSQMAISHYIQLTPHRLGSRSSTTRGTGKHVTVAEARRRA
jgi:uncharacterized repeat protein (TIGR01451 family)